MPIFETPEPISAELELGVVGEVRITASDRTDTVVQVYPSDAFEDSDVKAAKQVVIEYSGSTLLVKGPRSLAFDFSRKSKSVDVSIELPSGSRVFGEVQAGDLRSAGRLGECRFKVSAGNIWLEGADSVLLDAAAGHVTVDRVEGDAEIRTGSGKVTLGAVEGTLVVKNSNGDISVDRAGAGVEATTGNGSVRLGEVIRGSVVLVSARGDLDIGIAQGSAAWLEVNTKFGRVRNLLSDVNPRSERGRETVDVRGRTSHGDITIHRAPDVPGTKV